MYVDIFPQPPVPPEPLVLHLGASAQTFSIPDYASQHDDLDSFFIDQQSIMGKTPLIKDTDLPIGVSTEENALMRSVLVQMIRYCMKDMCIAGILLIN